MHNVRANGVEGPPEPYAPHYPAAEAPSPNVWVLPAYDACGGGASSPIAPGAAQMVREPAAPVATGPAAPVAVHVAAAPAAPAQVAVAAAPAAPAALAPPAPVPEMASPWTAVLDPSSGATYYYNSETGETSWTPPPSQANLC